ncbi:hypothetical protein Tco_1495779, partial [Tanacetum coccineum]
VQRSEVWIPRRCRLVSIRGSDWAYEVAVLASTGFNHWFMIQANDYVRGLAVEDSRRATEVLEDRTHVSVGKAQMEYYLRIKDA